MHYNGDNSYLFVNGKQNSFETDNKNIWKIDTIESKEKSCKEYIYEFSLDHGAFDKFDILNIDKCLMVKNNMKQYLDLLRKCLLGY